MRVIAGEYKGFRLNTVQGTNTRPTTDKIKETVFHMLGPFFQGGVCLDLFAGSGALGIEALSRGMAKAVFVDNNLQAIKCIRKNIDHVKAIGQADIIRMDSFQAIKFFGRKKLTFDLILIDPPYGKFSIKKLIEAIVAEQILLRNGIMFIEHGEALEIDNIKQVHIIKQKFINQTTTITILASD